jgi:hypothetical protein
MSEDEYRRENDEPEDEVEAHNRGAKAANEEPAEEGDDSDDVEGHIRGAKA